MKTESVAAQDFPGLEDFEAELAERSLYEFVKISWPVLHPAEAFTDGWHIGAIAEHLEAVTVGQIRNLIINIAPRHTKSEICSINWPAWVWIGQPETHWLYSGYNQKLSTRHSVQCRRLIESAWYRRHWGHVFNLTTDQNEKTAFQNNLNGERLCFGMTSTTGAGADFNVCDDPHDREDWKHVEQLKTNCDNYDTGIYPSVNNPNTSKRVIVMQRIHNQDLTGHLKKQGGWELLVLPTEYDPKRSTVTSIGWKDRRTKKDELLCPQRFSAEEVAKEKRRRRQWMATHQQSPIEEEGKMFLLHNWRYYTEEAHELVKKFQAQAIAEKQPAPIIIQSWDMAFKDLGTSSLVAGHVWMRFLGNKYLLDRVGDHLDIVATIKALIAMSERWPEARAKIIEGKANGPAVMTLLRGKIAGMLEWPPKGFPQMDSKESRAVAMQPDHEGGNIWLPSAEKYPWVNEVVEYFSDFPEGEYDDDIDAGSQALAYFEKFSGPGWRPL